MDEPTRLVIACHLCQTEMGFSAEIQDPTGMVKGVKIEVYQCPKKECGRKAVVVFEPAGVLPEETKTWIEREVMRAGSFFPQDYFGGRMQDRSRFGRD